ncbi:MAG: hypothetical protein ABIR94_01840, partial [Rubrivivax sp.]
VQVSADGMGNEPPTDCRDMVAKIMNFTGLAFAQFFRLNLRRHGWRLLLAVVLFVALKNSLQYLYALALVKLVLAQLA